LNIVKIVLTQDVQDLGHAGDVKNVAVGYARNYLIPQGLATAATPAAMEQAERLRSAGARRDERIAVRAAELAEQLAATTLTFEAKAGEKGRLYGSITTAEIADALSQQIGESFDRRKHILSDPIRHVGEHIVPVRLSAEVTAEVKVLVNPAGGQATESTAASEPEEEAAPDQPAGSATEAAASEEEANQGAAGPQEDRQEE
jgi:large subunit ribosomal protein L9